MLATQIAASKRALTMEQVVEFLRAGVNKMYPGRWEVVGDFGTCIETNGLGIWIPHRDPLVGFAAGVLGGLRFSPELVRAVSKTSCWTAFGSLTLSEGAPDNWMLTWGFKLVQTWLDPASRGTPQLILDVLAFIPEYVQDRIEEFKPKFGGSEWGVDQGWWYALMDRF